jgi:putative ABC transport system permease protein
MFPLNPVVPTIWVGDAADLRLMLGGKVDEATLAAHSRGEALVFEAGYLSADGSVTISWYDERFVPEDEPGEFLPAGPPLRSETLPGRIVPLQHGLDYGIFLSEDAAAELDLAPVPARLLGTVAENLSPDDRNAAIAAVAEASGTELWLDAYIQIGPGEQDPAWTVGALLIAGGISLAVALIAVGLAGVEGRTTQRTLAALGADPRIRRRMSAWFALIVVGYPALCGTLFALVAGMISYVGLGVTPVGVPVVELGLLAVAVPLLAAGAAWLASSRPQR